MITFAINQWNIFHALGKDAYSSFFPILSFFTITVIYSSFVVPQINELTKIRDAISKIPFPREKLFQEGSDEEYFSALEEARTTLENYLVEYELKENRFRAIVAYLWSLIAIDLFFIGVFFSIVSIIFWIFVGMIAFVFWFAVRAFISPTTRLRQIDWLARKAGLNPHNLWASMGVGYYLSNRKPMFHSNLPSDPVFILHTSKILLTGYRYFLQVKDEDGNAYFVAFGIFDGKHTNRNLSPWSTDYEFEIGNFPMNLLLEQNIKLNFKLYIFAPIYKNDTNYPFVISMFEDHTLSSRSAASMGRSYRELSKDEKVSFRGVGSRIFTIEADDNSIGELDTELFGAIAKHFKATKSKQSYFNLDGKLIESLGNTITKTLISLRSVTPWFYKSRDI